MNPSSPTPYFPSVPASAAISRTDIAPTRSEQVLVRLTPSEMTDLDRLCEQTGYSRQQILRAGLTLFTATETAHV